MSFSLQVRDNGSFHYEKKVGEFKKGKKGRESETESTVQLHPGLSLFHFRTEFELQIIKVLVKSADRREIKMKLNGVNPVGLGLPCTL